MHADDQNPDTPPTNEELSGTLGHPRGDIPQRLQQVGHEHGRIPFGGLNAVP